MKKRNAETTDKTRKPRNDGCVVRSWLGKVSRTEQLTPCAPGSPCALCVSLGLVKTEIGR